MLKIFYPIYFTTFNNKGHIYYPQMKLLLFFNHYQESCIMSSVLEVIMSTKITLFELTYTFNRIKKCKRCNVFHPLNNLSTLIFIILIILYINLKCIEFIKSIIVSNYLI